MEVPAIMRRAANVERNEGATAGEGRRVEEGGLRGAWPRVYKGKFAADSELKGQWTDPPAEK